MSRRSSAIKRETIPDYKFNDKLITQFVSCLMKGGKRSTAERAFYSAVDVLAEKTGQDGLEMFHKALNNVKPLLEVKSRRVGGANYQVPVEVRPERKTSLSLRWLIRHARSRPEKTMIDKLSGEIIDAANNRGGAIKKREDTHRMAEANKAFAHYRW